MKSLSEAAPELRKQLDPPGCARSTSASLHCSNGSSIFASVANSRRAPRRSQVTNVFSECFLSGLNEKLSSSPDIAALLKSVFWPWHCHITATWSAATLPLAKPTNPSLEWTPHNLFSLFTLQLFSCVNFPHLLESGWTAQASSPGT